MKHVPIAALALVAFGALAQAPVTSLRGSAPTRTTINPAASQAAQLVVPADFARLDDNAIIIIGGKPTAAGEVKRIVRSLDDAAIIIIGGKPTAAGDVKRQLDAARAQQKVDSRVASPSTLSPWPAPPAGTKAVSVEPTLKASFGIHNVEPRDVHENQKFVISGIALGDKAATVELAWYNPYLGYPVPIPVTTMRWTSTRINVTVSADLPILTDGMHDVTLIVTTANGERYMSPMRVYRYEPRGSR